jgi:pyruvate kinase
MRPIQKEAAKHGMTPSTNPAKHSKTKLVVTLGPSTSTPEQIRQMVEAGASVFRINLSHGAGADHRRLAEAVRTGAEAAGSEQVAVMFDTRGPEIRTGELDSFELAAGDSVWLYPDSAGLPCVAPAIPAVPVTYSRISSLAKPSDQILLDDGLVVLEVVEISGDAVLCQAVNGGLVSSRRKVTPPRPAQDLSALTPEDRLDLELAVELEVDFVAASFVRGADDVIAIRQFLEERGGSQAIIAKIENAAALDHISDILEAAEGLMVARGDLGVELPPEEVPILQKELIKRARAAGKPVITAT